MTTTSQVSTGPAPETRGGPTGSRPRTSRSLTVAAVAGIVAVVCAVLLPLLPVAANQPVVAWPRDVSAPQPTALQLTTQRPLDLAVRADCRAARTAGTTSDGLLLGTMSPASPESTSLALLMTVRGDQLTITSRGTPLFSGPLPPGNCAIAVDGNLEGTTARIDGQVVGSVPAASLADVDVLTTSLPATPDRSPAGLTVRVTVDDQSNTVPTPLKQVVVWLLMVALLVVVGALAVRDRGRGPLIEGDQPGVPRPAIVDLVVPAAMTVWMFLAPMTDDDGYYSAMAANVRYTGYVANYYQLYNQSFTPFTWIYYALSWWQTTFGFSPVVLRVPALLLGLLTWFLLRAFVHRALPGDPSRSRDRLLRIALAICFLGWWLPYDMGVRPEAVVALSVVTGLVCLARAVDSGKWLLAALGVAAGALGMTAAPTGFVALAPLLAGSPAVWRLVRAECSRARSIAAIVAIVSPGALVGILAFADGSLRDFQRAQQIFLGMQGQETWYSEIGRWSFLLAGDGPMGAFAKRAPVLLGVFGVVCFLVLIAVARGRDVALPRRMVLVGWTTLLGFGLLWLTPSKWTHHFGTLAGAGGALLALLVVAGPMLARELAAVRPLRWPVLAGAALALAVVMGLAGHGSNSWPYSWMLGVPHALESPQIWVVSFDQPVWWLLGIAAVAAAVGFVARRRAPAWRPVAVPIAMGVATCVFLTATTVYMVGGLALAAERTSTTWSPWADAVRDPLARDCAAASQMEVLDPDSAVALTPAPLPVPAEGPAFVRNGWFPSSPPPPVPGGTSWGSFRPPGSGPGVGDTAIGSFATPWYSIPDRPGAAMTTSVAGRTGDGNVLRVEYGRPSATGVETVGGRELGLGEDGSAVDSTVWRSALLEGGAGPPADATVLRLVADDTSTSTGGWVALTAPSVQRWTPLSRYLPAQEAVAVSWQFAFLFPCQRKPVQANGINEPSTATITWGNRPLAYAEDGIFQPGRGGVFAQSLRDSAVSELPTRLRDFPEVNPGEVYRLRPYVAGSSYDLLPGRVVVPGWAPSPNTTFSTPVDPEGS